MDSKKAYEMRKEELQWGDTLPKKEKNYRWLRSYRSI